jgi:pimaricinolide synthase PimS1
MLLTSRSGSAAAGAEELRAELSALGAEVTIAACDASDRDALSALLDQLPADRPLSAVIHAAGSLSGAPIESLGAGTVGEVFAPKVDAAWNLHELTKDLDLAAFVTFSSIAGVFGQPGHANYAAANAFLDALAQSRRADGLPATSIAWGLWARTTGITSQLSGDDVERIARSGIGALTDEQGLALFDAALDASPPVALALRLNLAPLRAAARAGTLAPMLRGLVRAPARRADGTSTAAKLAGLAPRERERAVLTLVRGEAAAVLGHASPDPIQPTRTFKDLGFDSLAAVELCNRLNAATGLRLPTTSVFDHPTPAALTTHLLSRIGDDGKPSIHAELDRIGSLIAGIPGDDPERPRLAAHLRALAADLGDRGPAERVDGLTRDRLASASDEELLDFIDEQVGPLGPVGADPGEETRHGR